MTITDRLRAALLRQIDAVEREAPSDRRGILAAVDVVPTLTAELGLDRFVDALLVDHKPRLLLRFARPVNFPEADFGDEVVLKVYPDRPRGEGPLMAAWRRRGVPVPALRFGERSGCSWLVLNHVPHTRVDFRSRAEGLAFTAELATLARILHHPVPELASVLRPLGHVVAPRWDAAVDVLHTAGYELPTAWRPLAATAYHCGSRYPLHGDLGLPNLGREPNGRLVVLDASALHGDRAFDATRWSARLAGPELHPEDLFHAWSAVEPLPVNETTLALLGAECVLEAGSRITVARRDGSATPETVQLLLQAARRLLR